MEESHFPEIKKTKKLTAGEFSLLTDESTDEACRAQLSIFVRYVASLTNKPKEEFVCIRKLGTSKTSEALMNELEQMFIDKNIVKTLIRFSGLDGTNAMSGEKKGFAATHPPCFPLHVIHELPESPSWCMSGSFTEAI